MEILCKEKSGVVNKVCKILSGKTNRWDEVFGIALKAFPAKFDEYPLVFIDQNPVLVSINVKLVQRRTHLRGEGEIGCCALLFADDGS